MTITMTITKNKATILAIETSCDDTCIALIRVSNKTKPRFEILSNIVSSQAEVHRKWGGVYPTLAKREHQKNLVLVLEKTLKKAKFLSGNKKEIKKPKLKEILEREKNLLKNLAVFLEKYGKPEIDAIAVTTGPGLEPCLWVGVNFAKALAYYWDLPIVPVNHIEAHIFANFIKEPAPRGRGSLNEVERQKTNLPVREAGNKEQLFPAVCLVVSGGHTQLIMMRNFGKYKILGETRDDAAGECFDKVAKILGLGYPGGPAIAAEAKTYRSPSSVNLPRPMMNQKNYDFSFSGLKTAVLYNFRSQSPKMRKDKQYVKEMCKETQQAIIDVLISKTIKAAKEYKVKTVMTGGGVAANEELRKQLQEAIKKQLPNTYYLTPNASLCTDNAAMVGIIGYYNWLKKKTKPWQSIKTDANLRIC